jgi:hypothetical protein
MLGTLVGTYSWHIYFSDEILLYGTDVHGFHMVWHMMYMVDVLFMILYSLLTCPFTRKFRSFCDDYFDALATLCCGYCDESKVFQTLLRMTWHVR